MNVVLKTLAVPLSFGKNCALLALFINQINILKLCSYILDTLYLLFLFLLTQFMYWIRQKFSFLLLLIYLQLQENILRNFSLRKCFLFPVTDLQNWSALCFRDTFNYIIIIKARCNPIKMQIFVKYSVPWKVQVILSREIQSNKVADFCKVFGFLESTSDFEKRDAIQRSYRFL
jgi:hypothetical protein